MILATDGFILGVVALETTCIIFSQSPPVRGFVAIVVSQNFPTRSSILVWKLSNLKTDSRCSIQQASQTH